MGRDVMSGITKLVQVTAVSVVVRIQFLPTKNKQTEVGEAMRSSSKQNKHMTF